MNTLYIHYERRLVCTIQEDDDGVYTLEYSQGWREAKDHFPLSLALKIREDVYRGKVVSSFFENLLPEGEQRRQIETLAGLPSNDDFAFLERFGEDCAGALTVSKYSEARQSNDPHAKEIVVPYAAIEKAIEEGRPVQYALDRDGDLPPFSLAGAQAKFPCVLRESKITLPQSGTPTTHIIKLPIRAGEKLLDSVENEYLSMQLAERSGLNVPKVSIIGEKIPLFCIERFDRTQDSRGTRRVHTQDLCQAIGRTSKEKYERHGGPTFAQCYEITRENSSMIPKDLLALIDWVGFNLAIGNNDSHAKNLSFLYHNQRLALAPFYDLISTTLYNQYSQHFAFRIGEVSSWDKISFKQVESFAKQSGLTAALVQKRWAGMFDKVEAILSEIRPEDQPYPTIEKTFRKIEKEVHKRVKSLRNNILKQKSG